MKVLFVACYVNNAHFIPLAKNSLDKYLLDCTYSFVCLNDAPDVKNGEENYLKICDILTESDDCFDQIKDAAEKAGFFHIKIPTCIHNDKGRTNHSSARHIENFNWFNKTMFEIFPTFTEYDYICYIDSDAFFCRPVNLTTLLGDADLAGPFIYLTPTRFYIHTGLFFINVKTVSNMSEICWDNTMKTDTGSDIVNFIERNPHYKIKKLGHYDGFSTNYRIPNGHTIVSLDLPEIKDTLYHLVDTWAEKSVVHFRAGSCFGVGCLRHRNQDRLYLYNKKMEAFLKLFST
jgi:hypothetical protein